MARPRFMDLLTRDPASLTLEEQFRVFAAALRADERYERFHILRKEELPLCGARCRDGHPCQARATRDEATGCLVRNGRCRLHGGLATGPRTAAGRQRIAAAARQRWRQYRQQRRAVGAASTRPEGLP